jgi:hypothetical protein
LNVCQRRAPYLNVMSMKLNKCRDKASLHKAMPRKYKELVQLVPAEKAPYVLAVLKDGVAHVRSIKKAASHLEPRFTLVVAAEDLTEEAASELTNMRGIPITVRNSFYWTEESYKRIQQFGGTKEKPRKNS